MRDCKASFRATVFIIYFTAGDQEVMSEESGLPSVLLLLEVCGEEYVGLGGPVVAETWGGSRPWRLLADVV
jgi:hypothetical protein